MPTNADVLSLQMERVRSKLQELFETSNTVSAAIKKGAEAEQISTRDYRIPEILSNGGDYGTFNADGGDMGLGSGMQAVHMISTYFTTKIGFQITNLQMFATATSERAVAKVFARTLSKAIVEYQAYDDYAFHTPGNAVFATATAQATTGGFTVYTLDTAFATQLCRLNMPVQVYDTTLATNRTSAVTPSARITAINIPLNSITLSVTVAGAAATDKILFDGVTGAAPPWKHGHYYFASSATSGSILSLNKATYPQLASSSVAVNGGLSAAHGLALIDQMTQKRDNVGNLKGIAHMKQRTAWYLLGLQISEWKRGKSDEMIDLVPSTGKNATGTFTFCGIEHTIDKHADRTRIDWLDFKTYGRAVLVELDYHTVEGRKLFELRGASGGVAAATLFYLRQLEDWYNIDPGALGYLSGLTIPSVP